MKAAIVAHYDQHGVIDDYVLYMLRCYRQYFDYICLVSTGDLNHAQQQRALLLADAVICRENIGYDFVSWRTGFESLPLSVCDEITFINDSCYGPCKNIANMFLAAAKSDADLWGASMNRQFRPHVQSFFMSFRANLIRSGFAKRFWNSVEPQTNKNDIIFKYEIGLSALVEEAGFKLGSLVDLNQISEDIRQNVLEVNRPSEASSTWKTTEQRILTEENPNPVQLFWGEMFKGGAPLIKIELFRDNPCDVNLEGIFRQLRDDRWYDISLILKHLERTLSFNSFKRVLEAAKTR